MLGKLLELVSLLGNIICHLMPRHSSDVVQHIGQNTLVSPMGAVREQSGCGDSLRADTQLPRIL